MVLILSILIGGWWYLYVRVADPESFLEIAKKETPELIILDITMPDMDGRDVLKELKKDETTKGIPVLMLTAKEEQIDRNYSMELGAYDLVPKPYDGPYLLKQIYKILQKKRNGEI